MTVPTTFSLALSNETATANLMADLVLLIGPGDVITLSGDLGAGKTAAARAMIRYLAGDDALSLIHENPQHPSRYRSVHDGLPCRLQHEGAVLKIRPDREQQQQ